MANLKFFKNSAQPQSATAGSIWFNTTLKTIEVYNGTTWEKFAGMLSDANWNTSTQKLTISKADGSSIELDFSNIASLSGVQAALSALETRLQGNIDTVGQAASAAQSTADAAQDAADAEAERAAAAEEALGGRIDGVAADLASEVTNRTNADNALSGRITTLESQITGLNGTLHFRGVQDEAPADPNQGDFYITTSGVEYIYDGSKWEKIGDTSAESASIAALEGRMTTAEGDIATLKTDVADRVKTSDYNTKVAALEVADSDNADAIEAVEGRATSLEAAITRLDGEQDTQDGKIQDNADAIAALEQWKNGLNVGVTSVTGDSYVTATPTSGAVNLSVNVTTAVTKDSAALVTSGAVATAIESALEWEEFV